MAGQRNSYGKRRFDYSEGGGGKRRHSGERDRDGSRSDFVTNRGLENTRRHSNDKRDRDGCRSGLESTRCHSNDKRDRDGCRSGLESTRRNSNDVRDRDRLQSGLESTRRGGEIAKQLRSDTGAKIIIGHTVNNCDERVVTIISSNKKTNTPMDTSETVSAAQDALIRVHDKIIAYVLVSGSDAEGEAGSDPSHISARLLVPSDQIGCVIGKGGTTIQGIRSHTGARIRIMKDNPLPACALQIDVLLHIIGDALTVKKALTAIAARLHGNPSRSSKVLAQGRGHSRHDTLQELVPYVRYTRDYPVSIPPPRRDGYLAREFGLKILCKSSLIDGVIGNGDEIINHISQDSHASFEVEFETVEGDCIINVSAKEYFEEMVSPTIYAAVRLQPLCSEKKDPDDLDPIFITRLLIPKLRVGCLLGKGGSVINEMRNITRASIKIVDKHKMPKIASMNEEMVQISGELDVARHGLIQVATRLKAHFFERERDSPEPSRCTSSETGESSYGGYVGSSYSRLSGSSGRRGVYLTRHHGGYN